MTNSNTIPANSPSSAISFRTSWFDCVTSFLLALMMLVASLVAVLALLWIFSPRDLLVDGPIETTFATPGANAELIGREFAEPSDAETIELADPELNESLAAVTEAVSLVSGSIAMQNGDLGGSARGGLQGDNRTEGDNGIEVVSRAQRWQLDFQAKDIQAYAKQLDFFQIELGVIGGAIQGVDYVSELSLPKPNLKRGAADAEKRLYFLWTQPSPLMRFDRQLIELSGAEVKQRTMLKFIPHELEQRLLSLELIFAKSRGIDSVADIAKTVFAVVHDSRGQPSIVVVSQRARLRRQD